MDSSRVKLTFRFVFSTVGDDSIEAESKLVPGNNYTLVYAYTLVNNNFRPPPENEVDVEIRHPLVFLVLHFTLDRVEQKTSQVIVIHMQNVDVVGSTHEPDVDFMTAHLRTVHGAFVFPRAILGSNVRIFEKDAVSHLLH